MKLTVKGRVYVWNEQRERWESESGGPLGNSLACRQEDLSALHVAMNALREIEGQCIAMSDKALRLSVKWEAQRAIEEIEG